MGGPRIILSLPAEMEDSLALRAFYVNPEFILSALFTIKPSFKIIFQKTSLALHQILERRKMLPV